MISEPELTGEGDGGEQADVVSDFDGRPARRPPGRRQWVWALGGAVAASVLWAAAVVATDLWPDGRPDLHGYRLTGSPCASSSVKPLVDAITASAAATTPDATVMDAGASPMEHHDGPAVDQAKCSLTAVSPFAGGGTVEYSADIAVDLHKKTDPRAEFEDQRQLYDASLLPVDSIAFIPHLGDSAYLLTPSEQTKQLKVLQGGAVFTVTLTAYDSYNVSDDQLNALHSSALPAPDMIRFHPALIETVRNMMTALRR